MDAGLPLAATPFAVCHSPLISGDEAMPQCPCCGANMVWGDPVKPKPSKPDKAAQRRRS